MYVSRPYPHLFKLKLLVSADFCQPAYARFLHYPQCTAMLQLLQAKRFRDSLKVEGFAAELQAKMLATRACELFAYRMQEEWGGWDKALAAIDDENVEGLFPPPPGPQETDRG